MTYSQPIYKLFLLIVIFIVMGNFKYKEQYAVIVICKNEIEQKEIYDRLLCQGLTLKVVSV